MESVCDKAPDIIVQAALVRAFTDHKVIEPFTVVGNSHHFQRRVFVGTIMVGDYKHELAIKLTAPDRLHHGLSVTLSTEYLALVACKEAGLRTPTPIAQSPEREWLLMTAVNGIPLQDFFAQPDITQTIRDTIIKNAAMVLADLHKLTIEAIEGFEQKSVAKLLAEMESNIYSLGENVDARAKFLIEDLKSVPVSEVELVFCHRDFYAHNILVDSDNKSLCLVDWEETAFAPGALEVAMAISPFNGLCRGEREAALLVSTYEASIGKSLKNLNYFCALNALDNAINALSVEAPAEHHLLKAKQYLMDR